MNRFFVLLSLFSLLLGCSQLQDLSDDECLFHPDLLQNMPANEQEQLIQKCGIPKFKKIKPNKPFVCFNPEILEGYINYFEDSSYADIVLDLDCNTPRNQAEMIVCSNDNLKKLARFGEQMQVYAYENAVKVELDHSPAVVPTHLTTTIELCDYFVEQTSAVGCPYDLSDKTCRRDNR